MAARRGSEAADESVAVFRNWKGKSFVRTLWIFAENLSADGYSHVLIPVVILFAGTPTGTDLEAAKHVGRGTSSSSACRPFFAQVVAHLRGGKVPSVDQSMANQCGNQTELVI